MRSYGWALVQCDWCPCKKKRWKYTPRAWRKKHVETQEDDRVQAKERGLRTRWVCRHSHLRLPTSRAVRHFSCSSPLVWQLELTNVFMFIQKLVHKCLWWLYSESPKIGNNSHVLQLVTDGQTVVHLHKLLNSIMEWTTDLSCTSVDEAQVQFA